MLLRKTIVARGDQYLKTIQKTLMPSGGLGKQLGRALVHSTLTGNPKVLSAVRRDLSSYKVSHPGLPDIDASRLMDEQRSNIAVSLRKMRAKYQRKGFLGFLTKRREFSI